MYSRSESGDGMAPNLASHSRSAFADSAVKPRRSPVDAGTRNSTDPRHATAALRMDMRESSNSVSGIESRTGEVIAARKNPHAGRGYDRGHTKGETGRVAPARGRVKVE